MRELEWRGEKDWGESVKCLYIRKSGEEEERVVERRRNVLTRNICWTKQHWGCADLVSALAVQTVVIALASRSNRPSRAAVRSQAMTLHVGVSHYAYAIES